MKRYEFFATCLEGLEEALADELRSIGIKSVRRLTGGVGFFSQDLADMYTVCLWSRLASRIMLIQARFNASNADELYAGALSVDWSELFEAGTCWNIKARGTNESLRNTKFVELKVKDAIVDSLRASGIERTHSSSDAPKLSIDVRIKNTTATISIDVSGTSLTNRFYLADSARKDASLLCVQAAGALALGGYDQIFSDKRCLDPVTDEGIMLIEAAMIACDYAPGLHRVSWGFEALSFHDKDAWAAVLDEAQSRYDDGKKRVKNIQFRKLKGRKKATFNPVMFVGTSNSSPCIKKARQNVRHAGLGDIISIEYAPEFSRLPQTERFDFIVSNFNCAERATKLSSIQADVSLYMHFCKHATDELRFIYVNQFPLVGLWDDTSMAMHTIGKGRIRTNIHCGTRVPQDTNQIKCISLADGVEQSIYVNDTSSAQFAARLKKNYKDRKKWALKNNISCYRLYDADLPDYAAAIDLYQSCDAVCPISYLYIAEYAPPHTVDHAKAQKRLLDLALIAPLTCSVRFDHVFFKERKKEKGGSQYSFGKRKPYRIDINENDHVFEVDLSSYLDTGIFLDHRDTRALIQKHAKDCSFLNLFAYTGSASVYAAAGGAREVVTVDMSQTYLDWASRNMEKNGFSSDRFSFVRADVTKWITQARRSRKRYDLIFIDPPTFSNSKSMGKKTWDVQRDHAELLIGASRLLSPGGKVIFSCNKKSFKLDFEKLNRYGVSVEDISMSTIPYDYMRTPSIHSCFIIRKKRVDSTGRE